MEEPEEKKESEAGSSQAKHGRMAFIAGYAHGAVKSVGGFLPKIGLFLFMFALPLMLTAYPAYLMAARLMDYAVAGTVEAQLAAIDMRLVEIGQDQVTPLEARKHYDLVFDFKDDKGKKYTSVTEVAWPAPGLKRRIENQYAPGDTYTLYLLPDRSIAMDDSVARDSFYRLTGLMGLVFVAFALFFMLWKRLIHRMPDIMPRFPAATAKSLVFGQLVTLVVAGVLAVLISFSPLNIPSLLFLGVYWGLAAFISLSLRLLIFEDAVAEPEADDEEKLADRRSGDFPPLPR